MHARQCRPLARWSCATEELGLGLEEILALHGCVERVIGLGAEIAVVLARNREVIAAAERPGACWPASSDGLIARRLGLADLGVVAQRELDLVALEHEAQRIDSILARAVMARRA